MHSLPENFQPSSLRPIFGHLIRGRQYAVIRTFRDHDHDEHPIGEVWTFLGATYLPYEDGLSFFVRCEDQDFQIRLKWRDDGQGDMISNLSSYVLEYAQM